LATERPSSMPTSEPSDLPSAEPSIATFQPSVEPTGVPSELPTTGPTVYPTLATFNPSPYPSYEYIRAPALPAAGSAETANPTTSPTAAPTVKRYAYTVSATSRTIGDTGVALRQACTHIPMTYFDHRHHFCLVSLWPCLESCYFGCPFRCRQLLAP
jgi:hypothetical protein